MSLELLLKSWDSVCGMSLQMLLYLLVGTLVVCVFTPLSLFLPRSADPPEDEFDGMDSPGDAYLYWSDSLVPGVHEVTDADVHFEGEELMDHAGIKVTSAGDVDADGSDDLLIGTERGQVGVGRAYLLLGLRQE